MTENRAENGGLDASEAPPDVDVTVPSIARAYDYILGGKEHFEIDRKVSEALYAAVPETGLLARSGRDLIRRVVTYLVKEAGVRQIIDIGSGLPTVDGVHEIAHAVDPETHVVSVGSRPPQLCEVRRAGKQGESGEQRERRGADGHGERGAQPGGLHGQRVDARSGEVHVHPLYRLRGRSRSSPLDPALFDLFALPHVSRATCGLKPAPGYRFTVAS